MRRLGGLVVALALGGCTHEAPARRSTVRVYTVGPCDRMSWPVAAAVSSPFGRRDGRAHDGIDLAVPEGTPVRAACDGVVVVAGAPLRGYGNLVMLRHAGALVTLYAHNARLLVREGEAVLRGAVVALSGKTGRVTAPHLHFEVRKDARPRDPLMYLLDEQPADRVTQGARPRRAGLPQAGHPVQGRHAAPRARPGLPKLR